MNDPSLLDPSNDPSLLDPSTGDRDALYNQLLLKAAAEDPSLLSALGQSAQSAVPTTTVAPTPGFCVKTKNERKEKVFINVCMADTVPAPKDLSDDELLQLLDSDDPTGFRVPMSIGEPHAEVDKVGVGCTVHDVVVNPQFMEKMKTNKLFQTFFLTVMLEGLDEKFQCQTSKDWTVLKNRRCVGNLQTQTVRTASKPFIMEMDQPGQQQNKPKLIQEVETSKEDLLSKGREPDYRIVQEPATGYPEFLVAEIQLPQVKVSSSVSLDLGEDRILLQTRSRIYHLDIYMPYNIVQEECGSQFNRKTRILTITMPVQEVT